MKRIVALALALCFSLFVFASDSSAHAKLLARAHVLEIENVKAGMSCYGYSTLGPKSQTKFTCTILGVLYDQTGPGHHRIIAKLDSSFEATGVVSGQSGSPVYTEINGKEYFVGTVSFGHQWSKGTIAGLTPAAEVLSVETYGEPSSAIPLQLSSQSNLLKKFFDKMSINWISKEMALGTMSMGVTAIPNQNKGNAATPKPGDVVAILSVYGDFTLGGFGTVSYVDTETGKIFLFGHPMENYGPCEFAIVPATVFGIQPMLNSSFLIAAPTQGAPIIGVIEQDRGTGIMGTLGKQPREFIPFKVKLTTNSGTVIEKKFFSTGNPILGPFVSAATVGAIMNSWSRNKGPKSVFLKGEIITSAGTITLNQAACGNSEVDETLIESLGTCLESILNNDFEKVAIMGVSLEVQIFDSVRPLRIKKMTTDETIGAVPCGTVNVNIELTEPRKTPNVNIIVPVTIPKDVSSGTIVRIVVGNGDQANELAQSIDKTEIVDITGFLKSLSNKRDPSRLYVSLVYASQVTSETTVQKIQEIEVDVSQICDAVRPSEGRVIVQGSTKELEIRVEKPSFWKRFFSKAGGQ